LRGIISASTIFYYRTDGTIFRKNKFRTLEYDDKLVRKLIQSVTVYEDHFVIAFKSGIEKEI